MYLMRTGAADAESSGVKAKRGKSIPQVVIVRRLDLVSSYQGAGCIPARLELDFVRRRRCEPRAAHDTDLATSQAELRDVFEQSNRSVHFGGLHEVLLRTRREGANVLTDRSL